MAVITSNPEIKWQVPVIQTATSLLADWSSSIFGDSEGGRVAGTLFSSGISSAGNTMANNVLKGTALTNGVLQNSGSAMAGAGAGIAANYIGLGINSLGGDTRLSRGIGAGVATGLGTVGGTALSNLAKYGSMAGKASNVASKASLFGKAAGSINPYGLALNVAGSALGSALGPSKEYGGRYGKLTQGLDIAYDAVMAGVNAVPVFGLLVSGFMALNKGLSNVFGSTDGMTVQDAILGSAFTPAPVKWANVINSSKTGTFNNQSWQNSEKASSFMGDAFGNLLDRFDDASEEAGKTYGMVSLGASRNALNNINYANNAWDYITKMADQNELQNIRSQYMSSINNQRYALDILGAWLPVARGRYGMKILNNATNHNIGMRLLSGAALIDNKQMILCSVVD